MTMQIIIWTLKLLDGECRTVKVLQAGAYIARLISWLGTARPVDFFNRVFDCYIVV